MIRQPDDQSTTMNLDGVKDSKLPIWYIGEAAKQPDGTWRCLANVEGMLCVVEVTIRYG